ncbi:MAG: carboxypeptidase regulatory-like domain-containing protein [Candidatus Thermoplasmatota archaeon]
MRKNGLVLSGFLALVVSVLLLSSGLVVICSESSESGGRGVKADMQTVSTYFDDNATLGARSDYVNGTGAQGWMVFWTNYNGGTGTGWGNNDGIITGAEKTALAWTYDPVLTETSYGNMMDVLYPDAYTELGPDGVQDGWDINSQVTIIAINASAGTVGWTHTKNTTGKATWALPEFEMAQIPVPTASLVGSDIKLDWASLPAQRREWTPAPTDGDATITDGEVDAECVGYFVYRSTTNATWNDNLSVGPVHGNISDWQLVSGVTPIPRIMTSWTDTTVEVGKTYFYSLKLAFNSSCYVETIWGGLGSNPITVTDTTPPTIFHELPFPSTLTNTPIPINATITDPSGIKSATLYYQGVGATGYASTTMTNTTHPQIYSAQIPGQTSKGKVYYNITTFDNYNNFATTDYYEIEIIERLGGVVGRVINSTNETEGIADANVTVFNETLRLYFYGLTNATGYFNITGVPPGYYTIRAKKQHYWRDERPIQVKAGEINNDTEKNPLALYYDATAPVIDSATATPPNGSIVTDSTPTISINYTDNPPHGEYGIELASVILKINDKQVPPTRITNKSITYTPSLLQPLEDGEYTVYVYVEDKAGNPYNFSWSFTIITKGSLQGFVMDYYGKAVEGATVELLNETAVVKTSVTDQNGSYKFENIAKGFYTVRVTHEEYTFKTARILIMPSQLVYRNFTAEAVTNYIFGYVLDENNKPLVGARVTASSPLYTAHTYTTLSGYYIILGLPAGVYYNLTAEKEGYYPDSRIDLKLDAKEPLNQDFLLKAKPEVAVPPAPKKPAFIPDVSVVAAIIALLVVTGVKALKRRKTL